MQALERTRVRLKDDYAWIADDAHTDNFRWEVSPVKTFRLPNNAYLFPPPSPCDPGTVTPSPNERKMNTRYVGGNESR
jgi:hypothetical protein